MMTPQNHPTLPHVHVGVVDDDLSVRQAIGRLLRSSGYQVTPYSTADEFLRSWNGITKDCLILDVHLPGLSGLELQKVIAAMRHPLPIIFISAYPDEQTRQIAMDNGAVGFLEKPFEENALIGLIEKALSHS